MGKILSAIKAKLLVGVGGLGGWLANFLMDYLVKKLSAIGKYFISKAKFKGQVKEGQKVLDRIDQETQTKIEAGPLTDEEFERINREKARAEEDMWNNSRG